MQNNGEAGQTFADLFENIKAQLRFLTGFKFVGTMACPDSIERVR